MKTSITRKAMFAEIHQDIRGDGKPHVFGIKYVKKDGTVGQKARVRKSSRNMPGSQGYRQNVNLNHILLLEDLDNGCRPFEICIDLILEYNGQRVVHNY